MPVTPEYADPDRELHSNSAWRAANTPALNPVTFDSLSQLLDNAILAQIYSEFLAQTRLRVHTLSQSADLGSVEAAAHTIKGTAGMLGAQKIAAVAERLENDPVTGSNLNAALAEFSEGCTALEAALKGKRVLG